jgi:hypothetical protein
VGEGEEKERPSALLVDVLHRRLVAKAHQWRGGRAGVREQPDPVIHSWHLRCAPTNTDRAETVAARSPSFNWPDVHVPLYTAVLQVRFRFIANSCFLSLIAQVEDPRDCPIWRNSRRKPAWRPSYAT